MKTIKAAVAPRSPRQLSLLFDSKRLADLSDRPEQETI
jgi:hypothetical protein